MIQIKQLEENYPFQSITWAVDGKVINTNKGKKVIRIWKKEEPLRWHINWRDTIADKLGIMTNRMIQTLSGEKALLTDLGWVTIHDAVEEIYPIFEHPRQMGEFIGRYAATSIEEEEPKKVPPLILNYGEPNIASTSSHSHTDVLERLKQEATRRMAKANQLLEKNNQPIYHNLVPPIESLDQAKEVHGQLFWENSSSTPVSCYEVFRFWLHGWIMKKDVRQVKILLDAINKTFPLTGDRGTALLATCLYPWELASFYNKTRENNELKSIERNYQFLSQDWNVSKRLVTEIAGWLATSREKVVQR